MSSTLISNPVTNSDRSKRKKKKKPSQSKESQQNQTPWKSDAQQQIYSSKLIQALNHVNTAASSGSGAGASASAPRRGRAVREAADKVLAVAAKGRTRWSRAILTNRLKLKFRKHRKVNRITAPPAAVTRSNRARKAGFTVLRLKAKSLPAVQRKVRVLGRLVPGCRKQPLPVILEEATDYIPALEMQVRAMSALFELLSRGGGISSDTGGSASTSAAPSDAAT